VIDDDPPGDEVSVVRLPQVGPGAGGGLLHGGGVIGQDRVTVGQRCPDERDQRLIRREVLRRGPVARRLLPVAGLEGDLGKRQAPIEDVRVELDKPRVLAVGAPGVAALAQGAREQGARLDVIVLQAQDVAELELRLADLAGSEERHAAVEMPLRPLLGAFAGRDGEHGDEHKGKGLANHRSPVIVRAAPYCKSRPHANFRIRDVVMLLPLVPGWGPSRPG
jgi:hypothetical protein